ncbi:MAG: phospholipase D-like domain-containing protein [Bacteroidota bacterium]
MRSSRRGGLRGKALVGTHSCIIGWTIDDLRKRNGLLGFAIRRKDIDPKTGEVLRLDWLGGYKRFEETDNGKADDVRSLEAPFQRFRWNDYSLRPERSYKYEVFAMRGKPGDLKRDSNPLVFNVTPSQEDQDDLGIYVNRGVTAAMAYLDRFKNKHPSEVGPPAYAWLSRGLKESILDFIARIQPGEALHIAIYEFFDHEIAQAIKDALSRNVDVSIVHDAKKGKKSTRENFETIEHFHLESVTIPRTTVNISHNKLAIRLKNGKPVEVWTGSANFSENAFNFQTNTALIVRDERAMQHFEDYFQGLTGNPSKADSKKINRGIMDIADAEDDPFAKRMFFSPISQSDILEASVDLIKSAKSCLMISAPFGVDKSMIEALHGNSGNIIEYGLVNSTAKKKIETLRKNNTRFFTPNRLETYMGQSWDAKAFGAHKIHAKTIVVDPWSRNPKVFIGSANFSKASCRDNDENAMLITGNRRLAAIIATEFMRMYDHYKSRYYIEKMEDDNKRIAAENKKRIKEGKKPKKLRQFNVHLKSDNSWSNTAFNPDSPSHKYRDRIVFSGG